MCIRDSFKIVDTYPSLFWQQHYSSSSLGVAGGLQYNVINLDAFFVSLSINGQYVLPTEIGIFRAHRIHVPPNAFSNVVYRPTDIHFGNIGAYLGVGLRLWHLLDAGVCLNSSLTIFIAAILFKTSWALSETKVSKRKKAGYSKSATLAIRNEYIEKRNIKSLRINGIRYIWLRI